MLNNQILNNRKEVAITSYLTEAIFQLTFLTKNIEFTSDWWFVKQTNTKKKCYL